MCVIFIVTKCMFLECFLLTRHVVQTDHGEDKALSNLAASIAFFNKIAIFPKKCREEGRGKDRRAMY